MTPALLIARGVQVGYWMIPLAGVFLGTVLGTLRAWDPVRRAVGAWHRHVVAAAVFLFAALLVFAYRLRIYGQTGPRFPAASDDAGGR